MLLVCFAPQQSIIQCVFSFVEDHAVLIGVITSVLTSSLWLRKYLRQKRAEAFFGFYAKLSLRLKALRTRLEENGELRTSERDGIWDGNIYSLIYLVDYIKIACPSYKVPTDELALYQAAAQELRKILLETENNVYPPGSDRKKWYESQHTLFSFCEFLENEAYRHSTNKLFAEGENEPKHIKKCKALIEAMDYIQDSINNAKY